MNWTELEAIAQARANELRGAEAFLAAVKDATASERAIVELKARMECLKSEADQLEASIGELMVSRDSVAAELAEVRGQLSRVRQEYSSLRADYDAGLDRHKKAESERMEKALAAERAEYEAERDRMKAELATLTDRIEKAGEALTALKGA